MKKNKRKLEVKTGPVKKKGRIFFTKDNAREMQTLGVAAGRSRTKSPKEVFKIVGEDLIKERGEKGLPVNAKDQLVHYLLITNLSRVAFRDNGEHRIFDCALCKGKNRIKYDNLAAEKNSLHASSLLYDRISPKLAALRIDVNAKDELAAGMDIMADIIVKYVPKGDRPECMEEIHQSLRRARDAWAG